MEGWRGKTAAGGDLEPTTPARVEQWSRERNERVRPYVHTARGPESNRVTRVASRGSRVSEVTRARAIPRRNRNRNSRLRPRARLTPSCLPPPVTFAPRQSSAPAPTQAGLRT
ncbi:hypothetical protein ZWY2020_013443 [Hordeum vulgare]|nr:hypothetical protein ZWY2020_013443 [Hordeum vulgare]